jgi:UDPglucose 6-dehydrogenase
MAPFGAGNHRMQVTIVGTGYVGLTTGLTLAHIGHHVICVDSNSAKLKLLRSGKSPIHEFGMNELLGQLQGRVEFTDDLSGAVGAADVILIAVGTPPKAGGEADVSQVEAAAATIANGLAGGRNYTLVVKSTVPIGTNRRVEHIVNRVLKERGVTAQVFMASNPEFLREGRALSDSFFPDRVLVGAGKEQALEAMRLLYQPLLDQSFMPPSFLPRPQEYKLPHYITTDATSAEVSKYACNAFLATKISFINEMGGLCERVGADVTQVARVMGLDHRIGSPFLNAGLGWGGSCFPKDTKALMSMAGEYSYQMPIIEAACEVNQRQRRAVVEKLQTALKLLRGQTIVVLGLAFKPDTDDVRESAAMDIVRILVERGAVVRAHDPIALDAAQAELTALGVESDADVYAVANGADAVLLATEWQQYASLDLTRLAQVMRGKVLVDARNFFNGDDVTAAGLCYLGVGR